MVEHRLFVTGEAPRRAAALPRRAALFPDVAVVLGDPRLPDPVKRDGQFNPEDAETVARLKTALPNCPATASAISTTTPRCLPICASAAAAFRAEFLRRGLQQRRLSGNARAGAVGDARHPATAAPDPPVSAPATTNRWCARSPRRSTCRCRPRPIATPTTSRATVPSGVPGADQAEFRRRLDRHQQGRGGRHLGRGDRLSRPAARSFCRARRS